MSDVSDLSSNLPRRRLPRPAAVLELLKPVTWFAPMWAFMCGVVSSGVAVLDNIWLLIGGVILGGPLVCATSQAVNDWYDRHVDAINQPDRPIPSGRIPGNWGLRIAVIGSVISLAWSTLFGPWVIGATIVALILAWAYSMPPVRLKKSGWWGPGAVALSYEGIAWFTGAAIMLGSLPPPEILALVVLYSIGAHGIMTLNDFKAVEGDRAMGIRSLPAVLGIDPAARLACAIMAVPQLVVIGLLYFWNLPWFAAGVAGLLLVQFALMRRLLKDPEKHTPWYNATGTTLYVLGMLVSAIGIGGTL